MFEVLSQKTIILSPLAFIVYLLAAVALGWIIYGLRGYKHWVRKFNRYHGYLPYGSKMVQNHGYVEYIPEVTRSYRQRGNFHYPQAQYNKVFPQQVPYGYPAAPYEVPQPIVTYKPEPELQQAPVTQIPYSSGKDDLKVVEGIGPKIEEILNSNGIHTWAELAQTTPEILGHILDRAGKKFQMHNPESWPYQASLADQGRWQELDQYQDHIYRGQEIQ
jgi:predicted flap endonuclease-1-like 5' DNA nuclease